MQRFFVSFLVVILFFICGSGQGLPPKGFGDWSVDEAVNVLNKSPWARQLTFTRVVGGIGSGIFGEKEIYSTFFVRFLSARPIREALVRLQQIQHGYDAMDPAARLAFDGSAARLLNFDPEQWIVVTVNFRSNDPDTERNVKQFLQNQSFETIRNRVHLSTLRFPQLQISAYYPPQGDSIGAKFVFPRQVDSAPVVTADDKSVTFQLDPAGIESDLIVDFALSPMKINGELVW
ncbi:MAG: hypothetical protein EHM61_26370 [Acidobacteria bacterium]|nr:MAG: hypothetical protein EHM61_26370 [Acidobacteriota bacterium]